MTESTQPAGDPATRPATLAPRFESFPPELTSRPHWVCWRWEHRADNPGKPWTKPPFAPNGSKASSTNPATWSSFDAVKLAYEASLNSDAPFDGVGFALSEGDPLLGVDLDHVINPETGEIDPAAQRLVRQFPYAERSPSGTGVRLIGLGAMPEGRGRKKKRMELYDRARFLTITGDSLKSEPLRDVQPMIDALVARIDAHSSTTSGTGRAAPQEHTWTDGELSEEDEVLDDDVLVRALSGFDEKFEMLFKGRWREVTKYNDQTDQYVQAYPTQSEADAALIRKLKDYSGSYANHERLYRLFRASDLYRPDRDAATRHTIAKVMATTFSRPDGGGRTSDAQDDKSNDNRSSAYFVWDDEILDLPPREWLVDGLFAVGELVGVGGDFGTAKSLLIQSLMEAIAQGIGWFGRSVREGFVVYVVGEGLTGLRQRRKALEDYTGLQPRHRIAYLPRALRLLDEEDVDGFLKRISTDLPEKPVAIVVDTLSRSIPGADENSQKDISKVVAVTDRIRAETGATVFLIHHVNSAGSWRGSTVARDAMDTVVRSERVETSGQVPKVNLTLEKQKDGDPADFFLKLKIVKHLDSVVLEEVDALVDEVLGDEAAASRIALESLAQFGEKGARYTEWMKASGLPKKTFNDHRRLLLQLGRAVLRDKVYVASAFVEEDDPAEEEGAE